MNATPYAAVITAVYDGYDTVKPFLPQSVECEAICVTDDPKLEVDGWHVVYEPRPDMHPNRAAKPPKMTPWAYTRAHQSVWIDASFRIVSPEFVAQALQYATPIAQFVHPERDCIYDEAIVSMQLMKYHGEPIEQQMQRYRDMQHPGRWGLWATGVIARKHTLDVMKFGRDWLRECMTYSFQDQLSEPALLRAHGLRPESLPGWHGSNPWLRYEGSGRH